jgi:diketogulonate reductase-like aldo/keto reductase
MASDDVTGSGRVRVLSDGRELPLLGLGVWQVGKGRDCVKAVRWALELGYRHIDTAQAYGNEESVGRGLRESRVARHEVFVTTKFHPSHSDPAVELEKSLKRLALDYVDLYLVHWPAGGAVWAWPGMERAREAGHARSIGVSNFSVDELQHLLATAVTPPVVDQVQFSPYEFRKGLLSWCDGKGIALEAYSTLGTGRHLTGDTIVRIARSHGRTPAQVLLRWCIERNIPIIPKSTHRERLAENAQVFDLSLSEQDMAELDALDRTGGTNDARETKWWGGS